MEEKFNESARGVNFFQQIDEVRVKEGYAFAYHLYKNKRYEEASHFFSILVQARPEKARYWKGFGACLQMQKNYEEAISCYTGAQILNKEKPDLALFIHAADCYFALGQVEKGLDVLETAKHFALENEDQRILNHVALMNEIWGGYQSTHLS